MNALKKLAHVYDKLEEYLLVYTMAACVVIVFAQVLCRYVLNQSLSWSEELTQYLFVWLIWLGTSLAAKYKEHIALTIVLDALSEKGRCVLDVIIKLIWIGICVFMLVVGIDVVSAMFERGRTSFSMPWLHVWVVYLAVPFSQGILTLRLFFQMLDDIKRLIHGTPSAQNSSEGG